ncbi:MAG: hypothetical protein ACOYYS_13565 [Chloroflexota bacterium]
MKSRLLLSLVLGLVFAFVGAANRPTARAGQQASAYYVDRNHPAASDSNPGSEALPWLTIQHAAENVAPGDTVYIKSGAYDERVIVDQDGAAGQKIAFQAVPRRSVLVTHGFNVSADFIRIEGFEITHDAGGWLNGGIWMGGNGVELVDNYIHDVPGAGITVSWAGEGEWEHVYIAGNYIYGCNKGISGTSGRNWLVENNEIERLIRPAGGGEDADYMRFFGSGHVIRGNYFHGTRPEDTGTSHVDCFQTYDNNASEAHDILFEHNLCLGFVHQVFMMEGSGSSHTNITIRYNVFQGFTAWGVCADNIQNLQVYNNTWVGLGTEEPNVTIHGVGFRNGTSGAVKNNIFTQITAPYWRDTASSYTNGYNLTFACRDEPSPSALSDLLDTDPLFENPADILGPDGLAWTNDDGLRLQAGSPAIDGGQGGTFIGAYPFVPALRLVGAPGDGEVYLAWQVRDSLPATTTWTIRYDGPAGDEPSPVTGIAEATRAYTLTGLTNGEWYTLTLQTDPAQLAATISVMPVDRFVYLPLARR